MVVVRLIGGSPFLVVLWGIALCLSFLILMFLFFGNENKEKRKVRTTRKIGQRRTERRIGLFHPVLSSFFWRDY